MKYWQFCTMMAVLWLIASGVLDGASGAVAAVTSLIWGALSLVSQIDEARHG